MTGSSKPTKGLEHFKASKNYLIRVLKSSDHDKWIGLIICMPQSIYLNNFLLNHPFCAYLMNREENLEPRFDILVLELAISIVYWLFWLGCTGNMSIIFVISAILVSCVNISIERYLITCLGSGLRHSTWCRSSAWRGFHIWMAYDLNLNGKDFAPNPPESSQN